MRTKKKGRNRGWKRVTRKATTVSHSLGKCIQGQMPCCLCLQEQLFSGTINRGYATNHDWPSVCTYDRYRFVPCLVRASHVLHCHLPNAFPQVFLPGWRLFFCMIVHEIVLLYTKKIRKKMKMENGK